MEGWEGGGKAMKNTGNHMRDDVGRWICTKANKMTATASESQTRHCDNVSVMPPMPVA
jgi:hypothetical protein